MRINFPIIVRLSAIGALCLNFGDASAAKKSKRHHTNHTTVPTPAPVAAPEPMPSYESAHSSTGSDYAVGAVLGFNFTNIGVTNTGGASIASGSSTGFTIGAVGDLKITNSFFASSGLIYSGRGIATTDAASNISLLTIPLLAKYKFENLVPVVTPYVFGGPTLDFAMGGTLSPTLVAQGFTKKSMLFGFNIGIGGEYRIQSNLDIGLEFQYHLGIGAALNTAATASTTSLAGSSFSAFEIQATSKWHF